jgi:Mg2+-importing ATPase
MNNIGLSQKEAEEKLKIYGPNKIEYFKIELLEIIKRNSLNFFNILLLTAGILSLILEGVKIETILIFFFLFLSIFIAVFQDYRSNKLAKKLLSYFKNYAWVKRDGKWQKILQEEIIPGDYVKVSSGYLVPADIKILKNESALIDESIITGESEPIYKKEGEIAYMGTMVVSGEFEGEVVATGKKTYFGSIAKKTLEITKETAYQKLLDDFAKNISYLAIFLIFLLVFINFFKPQPAKFDEILIFSIVLALAIVPEFLPAMTVLTLSLAGEKLAKRGLLIKRLSSLEDLGAVEILCTDKTGTITTNQLKLEKIIADNENEFVKYFLLDYKFGQELTPYEQAVLEKFKNIKYEECLEFIEDTPFDPETRVEKMIIKKQKEIIEIVKGAPEKVIEICSDDKEKWFSVFQNEDQNGFRTLALGINSPYKKFLGIASFFDPLKETSFSAINLARKLNLEIKILTGDSPNVARKVGLELGIINENEKVILGEELKNLEGENLRRIIFENKIFARVLPEDKLKIIETLQKEKFVAFLGEGVNDAPALKIAQSAIVVDTASDITKEEADIILKEKDLKLIVEGIYEGRKVLENIGKYLKHTMSDNFGNLTSVAILAGFLPFVPLTPIQVLLTNFLTDIPLIAFANDNVKVREIRKPVKMSNKHLILLLLVLGLVAGLINISAYLLVKNQKPQVIQTYIFYITTMTGLLVSFLIRTKDWFFLSKPSKFFVISSILGIVLTLALMFLSTFKEYFGFVNLEKNLLLISFLLLFIFIFLTEIAKKLFYKYFPDVI